jgi:hypothetical protein
VTFSSSPLSSSARSRDRSGVFACPGDDARSRHRPLRPDSHLPRDARLLPRRRQTYFNVPLPCGSGPTVQSLGQAMVARLIRPRRQPILNSIAALIGWSLGSSFPKGDPILAMPGHPPHRLSTKANAIDGRFRRLSLAAGSTARSGSEEGGGSHRPRGFFSAGLDLRGLPEAARRWSFLDEFEKLNEKAHQVPLHWWSPSTDTPSPEDASSLRPATCGRGRRGYKIGSR